MKKLVLALAIATAATCAQADYASAIKAYESKNYRVALSEFKQLAVLGDVDAQRNLGAMYFNAQGVEFNALEAYGWFMLHTDQLTDKTAMNATLEKVKAKFSESQKQAADAHVASLREQYGRLPLAMSLTPSFKETEPKQNALSIEAVPLEPIDARYTREALLAEAEGAVRYSFLIDAHGKAIAIHDESPVNTSTHLRKAALITLNAGRFIAPSTANARTTRYYYSLCFNIITHPKISTNQNVVCPYAEPAASVIGSRIRRSDSDSGSLPTHDSVIGDELIAQAEAGIASAYRALASRVGSKNTKSIADEQKISKLYYQAAIGGDAPAQYALAQRLFNGQGCIADERKAMNWLMLAAAGGDLDATLQLATTALVDGGEQNQAILTQLKKLADKSMSRAAILLASVYAQADTVAEQKQALALLDKMPKDDVVVQAMKARTYAGLRQFKSAVIEQTKAIVAGKAIGLDTTALEAALAAYQGSNIPDVML